MPLRSSSLPTARVWLCLTSSGVVADAWAVHKRAQIAPANYHNINSGPVGWLTSLFGRDVRAVGICQPLLETRAVPQTFLLNLACVVIHATNVSVCFRVLARVITTDRHPGIVVEFVQTPSHDPGADPQIHAGIPLEISGGNTVRPQGC